jgi:hypothetical protein
MSKDYTHVKIVTMTVTLGICVGLVILVLKFFNILSNTEVIEVSENANDMQIVNQSKSNLTEFENNLADKDVNNMQVIEQSNMISDDSTNQKENESIEIILALPKIVSINGDSLYLYKNNIYYAKNLNDGKVDWKKSLDLSRRMKSFGTAKEAFEALVADVHNIYPYDVDIRKFEDVDNDLYAFDYIVEPGTSREEYRAVKITSNMSESVFRTEYRKMKENDVEFEYFLKNKRNDVFQDVQKIDLYAKTRIIKEGNE